MCGIQRKAKNIFFVLNIFYYSFPYLEAIQKVKYDIIHNLICHFIAAAILDLEGHRLMHY